MNIAYVSNITALASDGKPYNTEWHVGQSLRALGHEVDFIQENKILPGTLVNRVKGADIFLFTRTWDGFVKLEDLRAIESVGIPTISFSLDKYTDIIRDGNMGLHSPFWSTQHVFSPENSIQANRVFQERGIHHHYLPPGVYEPECYIAEPVDKFKFDVIFIGGGAEYGHPEWQWYRAKLINFLRDTYGTRFGKFGGAERPVRGAELNQLCSSAKIAIGDSLCKDFIDSWYFSDRNWEVIGRGSCMISPYIPGVTDYFVDRKEIVLYGYDNFIQLKNLIDYYLAHDEERESIRQAGNKRIKEGQTYRHRMEAMLEILRSEGAIV